MAFHIDHEIYSSDSIHKKSIGCKCTKPCTTVMYQPTLSSARLSEFTIDRLTVADVNQSHSITEKYQVIIVSKL